MTHTHDDRVAERHAHLCAAYGCPLMGVMTGSTSGASDWSCALHANRPGSQLQPITAAINRYRWLAEAITNVRTLVPGHPDKAKVLERIHHDFNANGRPELYWAGGTETVRQWVNRLDEAFEKLVLPELLAVPKQEPLPKGDTWQNAAGHVPLWA